MKAKNKNNLIYSSYKVTLAYRGTNYKGWQFQKDVIGVANIIYNTIERIWDYRTLIEGASRTDAGVHARCQIAKILLPSNFSTERIFKVLNDHLPLDIKVTSLELCDEKFSPRYHCKMKEYHYQISFVRPHPWDHDFWWYCYYECDRQKIYDVMNIFLGTHDFTSFATNEDGDTYIDPVRTVEQISYPVSTAEQLIIAIKGKSFLRHMIRRMVGAAIYASHKELSVGYIERIMSLKSLQHNLYKAPSQGLILNNILY